MRVQALNLLLKLFDKLQLELNKNLFLKKWHWRLRKRHSLLPGESGFPLSHFYAQAKSSAESEELRKYMTQLRREIGFRLAEKVFDPALAPDGKPSKWWTCFSKRNFLKAPLIAWRIDFFLNLLYWSVIFFLRIVTRCKTSRLTLVWSLLWNFLVRYSAGQLRRGTSK